VASFINMLCTRYNKELDMSGGALRPLILKLYGMSGGVCWLVIGLSLFIQVLLLLAVGTMCNEFLERY
jgi:hypothetical protein